MVSNLRLLAVSLNYNGYTRAVRKEMLTVLLLHIHMELETNQYIHVHV